MTTVTLHRQIERSRFARHALLAPALCAQAVWVATARAYLGLQRAHTAHAHAHFGVVAGLRNSQTYKAR